MNVIKTIAQTDDGPSHVLLYFSIANKTEKYVASP